MTKIEEMIASWPNRLIIGGPEDPSARLDRRSEKPMTVFEEKIEEKFDELRVGSFFCFLFGESVAFKRSKTVHLLARRRGWTVTTSFDGYRMKVVRNA